MCIGWEPDDIVEIVRQLEESRNAEALATIENALQTSAFNYGRQLQARFPERSLADYASLFTDGRNQDCRIAAVTGDELVMETIRCRIFDLFKALGATDIGFRYKCSSDFGVIRGYDDTVGLTIEQCLMKGDRLCRHVYKRRQS